jgi:hypothetical protein
MGLGKFNKVNEVVYGSPTLLTIIKGHHDDEAHMNGIINPIHCPPKMWVT